MFSADAVGEILLLRIADILVNGSTAIDGLSSAGGGATDG